jgi:hypothetical protein
VKRALVALLIVLVLIAAVAVAAQLLAGPRAAVPTAPTSSGLTPSLSPTVSPSEITVGLPNSKLTPGAINPNVTEANIATTICKTGWTATIRPPSAYTSALKLVQIVEYGYSDRSPSHYEEDHLVPLELGGAPRDPRNLWPEPNTIELADGTAVGSNAKDHLENYLNDAVCAGATSLDDARRSIAGDWIAAWLSAGQP